jgi:hypothetical protein
MISIDEFKNKLQDLRRNEESRRNLCLTLTLVFLCVALVIGVAAVVKYFLERRCECGGFADEEDEADDDDDDEDASF